MSYEEAAMAALIGGTKDGRRESISEAPHFRDVLGIEPDTYRLQTVPTYISNLPAGVLGVTHIGKDGRALAVEISQKIAMAGAYLGRKYNKSKEWVKDTVYRIAKDVTNHEDYHVLSGALAMGEAITEYVRTAMESVTTRGRYKVKKKLGKLKQAAFVRDTNPYPAAWMFSKLADAVYEGPSGKGYKGYLADWAREPFYKPFGRLALQATKAGIKGAGNYNIRGTGVPQYVPAAA